MKSSTCLTAIVVLAFVGMPASANLILQVDPLTNMSIGIKLTGTLAGPVPTFNQNILTIQGLNTDTNTPIEWITQQRTLTLAVGTAASLVSGASLTLARTGNNPPTGLGDNIVLVFDQPLVAGMTLGLGNSVIFSTTGVAAINPDGLNPIENDLVLYWGSEGGAAPTGTFQSVNTPPLTGDLNNDGFVGIIDLNIVLGNWNLAVPPAHPSADPSGDGFVGIADLNVVLGNWNAGTPPGRQGTAGATSDSSAIPEPGTLALIVGSLAALTSRRR